MGVSKALHRLLRVRAIGEEQHRMALESAVGELRNLERARVAADARERQGRDAVTKSARSGELADRQAALVEVTVAQGQARALAPRIAWSERQAIRLRQDYLEKRVERRQAETLIVEAAAEDAVELNRRAQQNLDDWYGSGQHRKQADSEEQ
jgi:hypothetical protein